MDSAELAREAFAALSRRDFDGFVELMHPNVEFTSLIAEPEAKLFCGHAGVRQFLDQMLSVFPDFTPEVEWSESHGPVALSKVHFQGTGAGSGMAIEQTAWHVAWERDGKVIGWRLYRTEEEAREALTMAWESAAAAAREQPDSPRSRR
ncbi:MAG: nuclear transport factor 2 family protein [Thermoleophilaceae bacterium]|nr:nuclear transport factor 2 family protein [Thermoleophilaceae bacterium]